MSPGSHLSRDLPVTVSRHGKLLCRCHFIYLTNMIKYRVFRKERAIFKGMIEDTLKSKTIYMSYIFLEFFSVCLRLFYFHKR